MCFKSSFEGNQGVRITDGSSSNVYISCKKFGEYRSNDFGVKIL